MVIHHLEVQKFKPVLEPVEPVLQVQVCSSGKVVKEPDQTKLWQPYIYLDIGWDYWVQEIGRAHV